MTKRKKVKQKELIARVNEMRKKERESFLKQMTVYLEEARSIVGLPKKDDKQN